MITYLREFLKELDRSYLSPIISTYHLSPAAKCAVDGAQYIWDDEAPDFLQPQLPICDNHEEKNWMLSAIHLLFSSK